MEPERTRLRAPHEQVPTESLQLSAAPPTSSTTLVKPASVSSRARVPLDEETGERILAYIDALESDDDEAEEPAARPRARGFAPVGEDGHVTSFYVPQLSASRASTTGGLYERVVGGLDQVVDRLRLKTRDRIDRIDLALLVQHGLWVHVLLERCGVRITDLFHAHIVRTLDDLLQLRLQVDDLKRDRQLFNCAALRQWFQVDAAQLEKAGLFINVVAQPAFFPQELKDLRVSLAPLVERGALDRDMLRSLNYALWDLVDLGLSMRHIKQLKIRRSDALGAQPQGFGWREDDLVLLG